MERPESVVGKITQKEGERGQVVEIPIEEMPKLKRREEREQGEFAIWLQKMLILTGVSGVQLGREIKMDEGYISRLKNGIREPSKNVEMLIVAFFEWTYATVYEGESLPNDRDKVFSVWLNDIVDTYRITRKQIAHAINQKREIVSKICRGNIEKNYFIKYQILKYLEKEYGIDISNGLVLLENSIFNYESFGIWLKYEMAKIGLSMETFTKELDYKENVVQRILRSRRMPTKEAIDKIMVVLKSHGSKVTQEELIAFYNADARYKQFGNWLSSVIKNNKMTGDEIAKSINRHTMAISYYRCGRGLPSTETATNLFNFLETKGIDTEEGRQIWEQLRN